MDILTYALTRKNGGSGNGALTGLESISINGNQQLIFEFSDGKIITSENSIPAASAESIRQALESNSDAIRTALDIPAALTTASYQNIQDIVADAVTGIVLGEDNNGVPIVLQIEENSHNLQLPLANGNLPGLVKGISGSDYDPENPEEIEEENINKIYINDDGTMSVYVLNVNRLVQTDGDELIMGDID